MTVAKATINDDREQKNTRYTRRQKEEQSSHKDVVILHTLDIGPTHGHAYVLQELIPVLAHLQGCFCDAEKHKQQITRLI